MKRKITITMKSSRRLTTFCLTGALALGASGGALAAGNDAALQALFAQANYWHEKSHDELAMESLQKVLSVDANNTQALYLMALWSQQGGDMQAAAQWRARLAKAAPDSPGLQDLDNAKKMSQVPQGQLSLARQQARGGNIPGALATWRSMFNGNTPPAGLAAEYYLTMASDKSLYPQAISELRQYVAQHPQENAPRVALGKALTWREETRRERRRKRIIGWIMVILALGAAIYLLISYLNYSPEGFLGGGQFEIDETNKLRRSITATPL